MNAELQRQHDEAKVRKARLNGGAPVCRAISTPVVRESRALPSGAAKRRPGPPPAASEAIEIEHDVRVRCVRNAYQAERDRRRAVFAAEMKEVGEREMADLAACAAYRSELLAEVRALVGTESRP